MDKQELLSKIKNYSEKTNNLKENEKKRNDDKIKYYTDKIISFIPKMRDMYDIVSALYENSIINDMFITNGITHKIGFFLDRGKLKLINGDSFNGSYSKKPIMKFGVEGGGCCGYNLVIDLETNTIQYGNFHNNNFYEFDYGSFYHIEYLKDVCKNFDSFEQRLNDYVDNLK